MAPSILEETQSQGVQECTQTRQLKSDTPSDLSESADVYLWRCDAENAPASRKNNAQEPARTSADAELLAQERVAYWTLWIGIYTAVGLIAIVATFEITRQQTLATREIGQKQVRAYLAVQPSNFAISKEGKLFAFINVKNVGQSPATLTEIVIALQSVVLNDKVINPDSRDTFVPSRVISAGGTEIFAADWPLEGFDFSNGIKAPKLINIAGKITYTDVFGASDCTYFFASNLNPFEYFRTHEENLLSGALQVYTRPDEYLED